MGTTAPRYRLTTALGVTIEQTDDLAACRAWAASYSVAANARMEIREGSHTLEAWDAGFSVPVTPGPVRVVWLTWADLDDVDALVPAA